MIASAKVEPTFDSDGYPTEETLKAISEWPASDAAGCLRFVQKAWNWPDYVNEQLSLDESLVIYPGISSLRPKDAKHLRFATGGWSGNESLIAALNQNAVVRMLTWRMSVRGGLHIYEVPVTIPDETCDGDA